MASMFGLGSGDVAAQEGILANPADFRRGAPVAGQSLDLGAPRDAESWVLRTETELNCARSLVREVESQVAQNGIVELNAKYSRTVMGTLRAKQASTTNLTRALQDGINKVEDMIRKLKESDLEVQRAAALKQAPLCICKRRLELRSRRAPQELLRDAFQAAIESEEEALVLAREELTAHLQATRDSVPILEDMRQELLGDCFEKRRSGHIDHLCLLDGSRRPALSAEQYVCAPTLTEVMNADAPVSPGRSPFNAEPGTGNYNEDQRVELTKARILKAGALVMEGEQRLLDNRARMDLFNQNCERAGKRTDVAMKRSIAHLTAQKKSLEEQMQDADKMLFAGKISLGRTERKLRNHENPLQSLSRQFSMRQRRVERENIRDPVHDKLVAHLDAVKRSVCDMSARLDGTQNLVEELKATKARLQEALQLKTISLRLDLGCARVTLKSVAGYFFSPSPRSREVVVPESGVEFQHNDVPKQTLGSSRGGK